MKKLIALAVIKLLCLQLSAQGIYNLWNTSPYGENDNNGRIYQTNNTCDNYQLKFDFASPVKGEKPFGDLAEYNGKLYGITSLETGFMFGTVRNGGVIFEYNPVTRQYIEKYKFSQQTNGIFNIGNSFTGLTLYNNKFYGMTTFGGPEILGGIFEWDPQTNAFTVLAYFNNIIGADPTGKFIVFNDKLYALLRWNSTGEAGSIIEFNPVTGTVVKKHNFSSIGFPANPNWAPDGANPAGELTVFNNKLYGYTTTGGANDKGVIFEWIPTSDTYTKLFDFDGTNGSEPSRAGLTLSNNKLFGVTKKGGTNNAGVIFEFDPLTGNYQKKFDFSAASGVNPQCKLFLDEGHLYGMTEAGGNFNKGVIFEWDISSAQFSKLYDFNGVNGANPVCNLIKKNGKYFGVTPNGGFTYGVLFEWDEITNDYQRRVVFNNNKGKVPYGSLTNYKGLYYGVTRQGGLYNAGVLYAFDANQNSYTDEYQFDTISGLYPRGQLILLNDKLYGIAEAGGTNGKGVIFSFDLLARQFSKLADFSITTGHTPYGGLTYFNDHLYGLTTEGGNFGQGTLFDFNLQDNSLLARQHFYAPGKGTLLAYNGLFYGEAGVSATERAIFNWNPVSDALQVIKVLGGTEGDSPVAGLTPLNGKLYGTCTNGGNFGAGVLFELDPIGNTYTKKIDFDGTNGIAPFSRLTVSENKLLGSTSKGGTDNGGVLFQFDAATSTLTVKKEFTPTFASGNSTPEIENLFSLQQAQVAKGNNNNCQTLPPVVIDATNNNTWVAIRDWNDNAVMEIMANGNTLGTVTAGLYINSNAVREDVNKRLYLDRNISFNTQFQPTGSINIRLYIRNAEYLALKNAINSNGEASGISSINDLGIFVNSDNCGSSLTGSTALFTTGNENWIDDHVLSASIPSLSAIYVLNKNASGPVSERYITLTGTINNNTAKLKWQSRGELYPYTYSIQRSTDGIHFSTVATVNGANSYNLNNYSFDDMDLSAPLYYYRIKQNSAAPRFSNTIALNNTQLARVILYPNPAQSEIQLITHSGFINQVKIIDITGKLVYTSSYSSGNVSINIANLPKGLYIAEIISSNQADRISFMKK